MPAGRTRNAWGGALLLLLAVLVPACRPAGPSTPVVQTAAPDWTAKPPLRLDVARVEVVESRPLPAASDVGQALPQPPAELVRLWVARRLQPAGSAGAVYVLINEASLSEEQLARTPGLRGILVTEAAQRYVARYSVQVELDASQRYTGGLASAVVQASATVSESATFADRQRAVRDLAARALAALDTQLEVEILRNLSPIVLR